MKCVDLNTMYVNPISGNGNQVAPILRLLGHRTAQPSVSYEHVVHLHVMKFTCDGQNGLGPCVYWIPAGCRHDLYM